jgi:hypothetical protein
VTVYVDNARIPATVRDSGRSYRSRWSHLTADTEEELHAFAARLGLRRAWFQERCKTRCAPEGQPCPHWHYDVTEAKRAQAIRDGAQPIDLLQLGEIIRARRAAQPSTQEV